MKQKACTLGFFQIDERKQCKAYNNGVCEKQPFKKIAKSLGYVIEKFPCEKKAVKNDDL